MPIRMIDISDKKPSARTARARVRLSAIPKVIGMIRDGALAKGDCLAAAQAAGILAAKKTPALIPLCHPLPVSFVDLSFSFRRDFLEIESVVKASYSTGVEMEALCACAVAALTVYDMTKAHDKNMTITDLHVVEKRGGKSDYHRVKSKNT